MSILLLSTQTAWPILPLGELCNISIGRTPARERQDYWGPGTPWLSIADMNQGREIASTKETITALAISECNCRLVPVGTVLLSFKLSIGKVSISTVPLYTNEAIAALPIIDPDILLTEYLYWALRSLDLTSGLDRAAKGLTLNKAKLLEIGIPLPPLPEQRRIAAVLDRADALRAKRRAALAQLDALTQAIFLDMFGDPATNPKGWPVIRFQTALSAPLRNGLSPSSGGKVNAKVLTLSAITGDEFDASACKVSTFLSTPPSSQAVDDSDFLICRGNGNVRLVGKGYFPTYSMLDVTFPDTMIAARIAPNKLDRAYLQHVWNSGVVRRQIETLARTTNGTFKVNQTMLESIEFCAPPLTLQHSFARRIAAIEQMKAIHRTSRVDLDTLFASLQHRAFRGELFAEVAGNGATSANGKYEQLRLHADQDD